MKPVKDTPISESDVCAIAKSAGTQIMELLQGPFTRDIKSDGSTVTSIDYAMDALLKEKLPHIRDIPILSEEDPLEVQQAVMRQGTYWCIDPLDGTSTACAYAGPNGDKTRDYFGVLIGLVKDGVPVFGVAHYPAKDGGLTYYTNGDGSKAFRQRGQQGRSVELHAERMPPTPLRNYARTGMERIGEVDVVSTPIWGNSNLAIAEKSLDIGYYPEHPKHRPGYWDVVAQHAILRAAGGEIYTAPSTREALARDRLKDAIPLRYTEAGLHGMGTPYVAGGLAGSLVALRRAGLNPPGITRERE